MKSIFYISFLITLCSAFNPGLGASLNLSVIEQAKETFLQLVLNKVNDYGSKLPDIISNENLNFTNNLFKITQPSDEINLTATDAGTMLFSIKNLTAIFDSDLEYYNWLTRQQNGILRGNLTDLMFFLELRLGEQTLPNDKTVPAIEVVDAGIYIEPYGLNMTIAGDFLFKVISDVKSLFLGPVRMGINDYLRLGLKAEIPQLVNALLNSTNGTLNLYKGLDLDISLPYAPTVNSKNIEIGMKGLFYTEAGGEADGKPQPPVMPKTDPYHTSALQLFLSTYMMNSLTSSLLEVQDISITIDNSYIPANIPISLTTTYLEEIFPGLSEKYGKGMPMKIQLELNRLGDFVSEGKYERMSFSCDTGAKFFVVNADLTESLAATLSIKDLAADFQIVFAGMTPEVDILSIDIGQVTESQTNIGNLNLTTAVTALNNLFTKIIPAFDYWFAKQHFKIPSSLFGLVKLSDISIIYYNGFVEVGLTPTFISPDNLFEMPLTSDRRKSENARYAQYLDGDDHYRFTSIGYSGFMQ